jgi:hypothetical protein
MWHNIWGLIKNKEDTEFTRPQISFYSNIENLVLPLSEL